MKLEVFEGRIELIDQRMNVLLDVIERYARAKENLDQFMEGEDSNVETMIERINVNVEAAKKSHAALNETKLTLQETVNQMEGMSKQAKETLDSGIEAAKSSINAAITINSVL